ncbi:hypothetical protein [Rheinheimera sp. MMS21-TC3]|uniref:hypothetical protein n=1 Tax=Rheinheimera sp. MMS21-TC3 TaxID=3072790 RepID=UPI0028C3BA83|nr:hypothetical protein [Rheinheimera sp. MMS21-TC3]WNO61343.1 hypothetical protein RDV63_10390 [Rheinheimera sp. MMS21-TC3]
MYENKSQPLASGKVFGMRILLHLIFAAILVILTLAVGVAGHIYFDNMRFSSALVASITLTSGLGLSILPNTTSGQLFASLYGILSSYIYIATTTIVIAPILHRLFHKFHLDE